MNKCKLLEENPVSWSVGCSVSPSVMEQSEWTNSSVDTGCRGI